MQDNINHPTHYTSHPSGIECVDIAKHHCFCIGNVFKYIWRAGLKDNAIEIEDLKKAVWYLNKKIDDLEREKDIIFYSKIKSGKFDGGRNENSSV
jgi:hypothetical protein